MCLSIPYKIKGIKDGQAIVQSASRQDKKIDLSLLKDLSPGDWVLVLNNFAIEKISNKDAQEIIKLYNHE